MLTYDNLHLANGFLSRLGSAYSAQNKPGNPSGTKRISLGEAFPGCNLDAGLNDRLSP